MSSNKFEESIVPTAKPSVVSMEDSKSGRLPDGFMLNKNGLHFIGASENEPIWICSHIEVTASTRDNQNNNWGRVLESRFRIISAIWK